MIVAAVETCVTLWGIKENVKEPFSVCGNCVRVCAQYLTSLSCILHSCGVQKVHSISSGGLSLNVCSKSVKCFS